MSAPRAPLPSVERVSPPPPGHWEIVADPGQYPRWVWFPDPSPPPAPPPPAATRDLWAEFRRRGRRVAVVLACVSVVCAGVVAFDEVIGQGSSPEAVLEDGGSDLDALIDGAEPVDAEPVDAEPDVVQPLVLDEAGTALGDAAQGATDAFVDGDLERALAAIDPGCMGGARELLGASIEETRGAYDGVRLTVASVVVDGWKGEVSYRVDGTPTEAFGGIDVPSADVPELWVLLDGQWFRAVAGCTSVRLGDG